MTKKDEEKKVPSKWSMSEGNNILLSPKITYILLQNFATMTSKIGTSARNLEPRYGVHVRPCYDGRRLGWRLWQLLHVRFKDLVYLFIALDSCTLLYITFSFVFPLPFSIHQITGFGFVRGVHLCSPTKTSGDVHPSHLV